MLVSLDCRVPSKQLLPLDLNPVVGTLEDLPKNQETKKVTAREAELTSGWGLTSIEGRPPDSADPGSMDGATSMEQVNANEDCQGMNDLPAPSRLMGLVVRMGESENLVLAVEFVSRRNLLQSHWVRLRGQQIPHSKPQASCPNVHHQHNRELVGIHTSLAAAPRRP